ncbi:hypothetical protein GOODEAATRI_033560, partial [Goodea atripinnis]
LGHRCAQLPEPWYQSGFILYLNQEKDGSGSFATSDRTLQSQSVSSCGPDSAERQVGSQTCSHLPWRERLLSGAGTSPECSDSGTNTQEVISADGDYLKPQ